MKQRYIVALGSNRRHHRFGSPAKVIAAALEALGDELKVKRVAPVVATLPLGHSRRRFANSAAVVQTKLAPDALLDHLQRIEHRFGRRRRGRPWGDRVLDLDLLLWDGGAWASPGLVVPHVHFRTRTFALGPAARIAPRWRDPLTGLTLSQLDARLTRRHRLPIARTRSGP